MRYTTKPNAVFVDRHSSYARILKICQDTPETFKGMHYRKLVAIEGDEVSVIKTDGVEMFTGRQFESGRESFTILQKPEDDDGDYCLYMLLNVKVAPPEEDIWL